MLWLYDLLNIGLVLGAFALGGLVVLFMFTGSSHSRKNNELDQLSSDQLEEVLFYFRNMKLAEYGAQRDWQ